VGTYLTQTLLERAISPRTVLALYDDDDDGTADADAIELNIDRAEGEVDSRLLGFGPMPLTNPADRLAMQAALEFLIAFSFERHPEYVRTFGEGNRLHYDRAVARCDRIQAARQRLPDNNAEAAKGEGGTTYNIGGIVIDDGPRTMVTSADGTKNSGDF
jgi:hypothetical protein